MSTIFLQIIQIKHNLYNLYVSGRQETRMPPNIVPLLDEAPRSPAEAGRGILAKANNDL